MKRRVLSLGVVLAGVLLAASPAEDARAWLRRGNEVFLRGDYPAALSCYEKAEAHTTDPGQVAFNLAAARYFLAQARSEGRNANLQAAEELYRCCLDPADPNYLQALYGLGTCLLQSAGPTGSDELGRAVDVFDRCLVLARDPELLTSARHNREVARFRLTQTPPAAQRNSDPPNSERSKNEKPPRNPKTEPGSPTQQPGDKRGEKGRAVPVDPRKGQTPSPTDEQPPPGRSSKLPPVPDNADLPPLSPRDAAEHLEQAGRRILEEEKTYRQKRARPPLAGVRDW